MESVNRQAFAKGKDISLGCGNCNYTNNGTGYGTVINTAQIGNVNWPWDFNIMNHNRTDKENKSNNVNLKGIVEKLLTAKGTHIANELVLRKTRPTFTKLSFFTYLE